MLIEKCFKCHGSEKASSGFRVDSRQSLLKGGELGAAIVPGKPAESLLLDAIDPFNEDLQMPPDDPLPANVVADFRQWIQNGAAWPASVGGVPDSAFQGKRHWAFLPIARPQPPVVRDESWIRTPVDRFVARKLDLAGIVPSAEADRATLIRRLKFDLLGLPPTYEETQAFVLDESASAWQELVDRYLASPHYGERWGRHWLDVARYADTKGYVFQEERKYPFAYTYRDWVVRSLNEDLPYDQFLTRQIAADWLVKEGLPESEQAAMGFLTVGRRFLNNINDIIDDRLDVISRGTMALTVTCARCHDHKYDPIPQADYYSLFGVLRSSTEPKEPKNAMPLFESDQPFNPYIFLRGGQGNRGPQVPRQFLQVVAGPDRTPFQVGSGRLELARAIASPDNPLTARVIVNRVWLHHFHSSLVTTPSDFGLRCESPTHPELLDWLAAHLIDSEWSLKEMHRTIVNSATWRQASIDDQDKRKLDSENRLLWRMNRNRLELEPMRDAILSVGGDLNLKIGGEAVEITADPTPRRRTIYGFIDRQNLPGLFRTFDFAGPDTHSPGRFQTSVPQQTLYLRNSPFLVEESRRVVRQLNSAESPSIQMRDLFRMLLARDPGRTDVELAEAFLAQSETEDANISSLWQYGYGRFDQTANRIEEFQHLPHFTGKAWQGGPATPDVKLGWAILRADGGHPGGPHGVVVYRWTAPHDGRFRVTGSLNHPSAQGNGIEGIISVPSCEFVTRWPVKHGKKQTVTGPFQVAAGDHVDLIVDGRTDIAFDSFNWSVEILNLDNPAERWPVASQFRGPLPNTLNGWEMLAQALMLSNEFQFVD
ncbi:MAG: PSD1 and planctomycete cytochrome C domain-containing protein [Planctomycetota bacterium]|nr:PSD1 and planctomycete cytochrome C domain-containing protein [Planctomycetota bacterium]